MANLNQILNILINADAGNAKREIKGFQSSFTELKSKIDLAKMAMDKMVQAFEFAQAGAELERTRGQFDNLAASIGSSSDAILTKMRDASSGMMSNAEMISAAAQIISLGLADNETDVIRLATIVSELGWDMQQVILTFANNSTMRLDALGLSVQNVTAKAKAFEEQGFDADKAFDLAVMDAAEEKIELSGSMAETAAGQYKMAEASAANFSDELKKLANTALLPTVMALNKQVDAAKLAKQAFDLGLISANDYRAAALGLASSQEAQTEAQQRATEAMTVFNLEADRERDKLLEIGNILRPVAEDTEWLADATELTGSAAIYAAQGMASVPEIYQGVGRAAGDAVEPLTNFADALDEAAKGRPSAFESLIADIKWFMAGGAEVAQFMADFEASLAAGLTPDDAALQAATTGLVGSLLAGIEAGQTDFEAAKQTLMDTLGIDATEAEAMLTEFATAADAIAEAERQLEYAIILDPNSERILANLNALLGIDGHTLNLNIVGPAGGSFGGVNIGDTGSRRPVHFGTDFVVPPGFNNDSYPLNVESGEHVTVTPASEVASGRGGAGGSPNVIVMIDGEQIAARVLTMAGRDYRQTRANGGGYTGR